MDHRGARRLGLRAVVFPSTVSGIELVLYAPLVSSFIAYQNYATGDPSAGAQLFLLWPVVYAALFLNRVQTAVTLAVTVAADGAALSHIPRATSWVVDVASLCVAFTMASVMMHLLRRRNAWVVEQAERQANEDQLTGLDNRRAFALALSQAHAAGRAHGRPVSLVCTDVDHFKAVNDSRGHGGGDGVLMTVAAALRESVRDGDTVARLGGDEFVVLMPGCTAENASTAAEAMRRRIREATGGVTVSVGVAEADADGDSDDLMRASDQALYRAKLRGRDTVAA